MTTVSAVMCVYHRDQPEFVCAAIESVLNQSKRPNELLVLVDGPISRELKTLLNFFDERDQIKLIELDANIGRGAAKNKIISHAQFEYIMIMDADDICRPKRLEIQLKIMLSKDLDLLGGYVEEFGARCGDLGLVRKVPLEPHKMRQNSAFRSPVNHVTLLFRKDFFDYIGGYKDLRYTEDWDFAIRAMHKSKKIENISHVLVDVRQGVGRRKGRLYFIDEAKVLRQAYSEGFISLAQFFSSLFLRFLKLIMPHFILPFIYSFVLRRKH